MIEQLEILDSLRQQVYSARASSPGGRVITFITRPMWEAALKIELPAFMKEAAVISNIFGSQAIVIESDAMMSVSFPADI